MRCTSWYTRPPAALNPAPLTLADWTRAYEAGASPRQALLALQRRLEVESPPGAWIAIAGRALVEAQVEALLTRAAGLDGAQRRTELPLFGVPFAVKDNIDVAGLPTTAACPAFAYQPAAHAGAVAKLIAAGAVCVGKTNLDQFATGLVGTRSPYGRPSSACAPERISGGSSSGSAVVVARGDVPFALGTDTAGSGRVPAGFNQVVGLKPTPGRVGTSGVVPACRSLDCVAVFALTVADAAGVLAIVEGPDHADAYSEFVPGPARFAPSLRIGIPSHAIFSGDAGYGPAYEAAVTHVQSLGHSVAPIDFSALHGVAEMLYAGPWVAERHAVVEKLLAASPEALDPVVRSVIESGARLSATDAFRGQYRLREARADTRAIWSEVDLLMVPTAPGHPRHAEVDADPIAVNAQLGTYTNFVNLLGWCALAVPAGVTAQGLPFGVTFIGPASADAALARFGETWQRSLELTLGATGARRDGTAHDDRARAPSGRRAVAVDRRRRRAPHRAAAERPAHRARRRAARVGAHGGLLSPVRAARNEPAQAGTAARQGRRGRRGCRSLEPAEPRRGLLPRARAAAARHRQPRPRGRAPACTASSASRTRSKAQKTSPHSAAGAPISSARCIPNPLDQPGHRA